MFIKECRLDQAKLMKDYIEGNQPLDHFFDYNYKNDVDYFERQKELMGRDFQRETLTDHLLAFNKKYQCSSETVTNIEKIIDKNSLVVVGGQQAGVLTGPLYTIHKIISIIKLAKTHEERLNVPVVPVFWIAGEDHDFDEINHIYNIDNGKLQKRKIHQQNSGKKSVSNLEIDRASLHKFVKQVFLDGSETNHTKSLLQEIDSMILKSKNYIDFFSFFIHKLFKNSGIVLMDSHHPELRKLEVEYLKQIVYENKALNESFLDTSKSLFNCGYGEPIERVENNAHLFYHLEGTRTLLERTEQHFTDKQKLMMFSKEELLHLIEKEPENFSNNVVTRPLMQEFVLPVLAFVGGPGEIAYWATLKKAFHLFGFKVPPVVPRLSITLVEPYVEKWLQKEKSSVIDVITTGRIEARNNLHFWEEKGHIEETFHRALKDFENIHSPLQELISHYDKGLAKLAEKNESIIKKELTFLAEKIENSVRQKYEQEWLRFDLIEANILPNGGLQERSLNIIKYLNDYGLEFVSKLVELPFEFNDTHKLIYLTDKYR